MRLTAAEALRPPVDDAGPFGVIDIGSNSIRLVIFDVSDGYPVPFYNESVSCGLGRGVGTTGALAEDAVECALAAVQRFTWLAREMGVDALELVATAAIRDASNGADFVAAVLSGAGKQVRILGGEEEARLAGLGVAATLPGPRGIIGDLGGGSLELIRVDGGAPTDVVTLPLGVLRVDAMTGGDMEGIRAHVASALAAVPWLEQDKGRTFYPVGGSWRALARIHMVQRNHPLHIIHGYSIDAAAAMEFARTIAGSGTKSLSRIPGAALKRIDMLPAAATILRQVLVACEARRVTFSAAGLREGVACARLAGGGIAADPLIAMAEAMGRRDGRFGDVGRTLLDWMAPLYLNRHKTRDRLRHAACALSDIGWREHPDYRAEQAMLRILRHPLLPAEHPERAFIAYAVFVRYGGAAEAPAVAHILPLMSKRAVRRAEVLGSALRLAYRISGGAQPLLAETRLIVEDGRLDLELPDDLRFPDRKSIQRPFRNVAELAGLIAGRLRS